VAQDLGSALTCRSCRICRISSSSEGVCKYSPGIFRLILLINCGFSRSPPAAKSARGRCVFALLCASCSAAYFSGSFAKSSNSTARYRRIAANRQSIMRRQNVILIEQSCAISKRDAGCRKIRSPGIRRWAGGVESRGPDQQRFAVSAIGAFTIICAFNCRRNR
jgi:hypothetical protein